MHISDLSREEYESSLNFLGADIPNINISFDESEDGLEGFIVVTINSETNAFYPLEFCELYMIAHARKADKAKLRNGKSDLIKQSRLFLNLKTHVTQVIERYKRWSEDNPKLKKYDFDSFIKQVDVAIAESRFNIEVKLLNSQINTNDSVVNTNKIMKRILGVTILVALLAAIPDWYGMTKDREEKSLRQSIDKLNNQLLSKDKILQQKDREIKSLTHKLENVSKTQERN